MTPRERADRLLVARGLFESRAKAQAAIAAGLVTADDRPVQKPSDELPVDARIAAAAAFPWVSRGGVKLAHALDTLRIDVAGAPIGITASIGVAEASPAMDNIAALMKAADEVLYRAKNAGRNRVVAAIAEPPAGPVALAS